MSSLLQRGEAVLIDPSDQWSGVILRKRFTAHSSEPDRERLIAAGNMDDAWIQMQSGYCGPMVLQMPTLKEHVSE